MNNFEVGDKVYLIDGPFAGNGKDNEKYRHKLYTIIRIRGSLVALSGVKETILTNWICHTDILVPEDLEPPREKEYEPMDAKALVKLFDEFVRQNRDILEKKGNDYSGNKDRLRNFKASEVVKVKPEYGILVRIMDKITRISELLEHDAMVKSESIEDTVSDMSNYVFLLYALIKSKKDI